MHILFDLYDKLIENIFLTLISSIVDRWKLKRKNPGSKQMINTATKITKIANDDSLQVANEKVVEAVNSPSPLETLQVVRAYIVSLMIIYNILTFFK